MSWGRVPSCTPCEVTVSVPLRPHPGDPRAAAAPSLSPVDGKWVHRFPPPFLKSGNEQAVACRARGSARSDDGETGEGMPCPELTQHHGAGGEPRSTRKGRGSAHPDAAGTVA